MRASKKAELGRDEGETRPRQVMPWARSVHGAATVTRLPKRPRPELAGLSVPNMFEVVTFFRARGDSYARIASIGFCSNANPDKALTARELKMWFEGELQRRVPRPAGAKSSRPRSAGKSPRMHAAWSAPIIRRWLSFQGWAHAAPEAAIRRRSSQAGSRYRCSRNRARL